MLVFAGILAFLMGAAFGSGAVVGVEAGVVAKHEPQISAVYGELPRLCRHDLKDIEALAKRLPGVDYLQQMAAAAKVMCADAQRPNTPANQALLLIDVMRAYDKH
jgi:hypothetical protein